MIPYFVIDQFNLGPLKLYTWGLFVALGFSAGYLLLLYLARQKNIAPEKTAGLALAIFFGGALGAKALPVALLPGGFFNNLNLLFSPQSGAAFMGGLVGAILFGWGYIKITNSPLRNLPLLKGPLCSRFGEAREKKRGLYFWEIADLLVLPTALGIGIGRLGCVLINEHQGAVTNLPWGILWPDGLARHPVGIYESLVGFGLFVVFWLLFSSSPQTRGGLRWGDEYNKKNITSPNPSSSEEGRLNGKLFLLFLISYSILRFFLEFTRASSGPLADPRWSIFSVSQWIALFVLTLSIFMVLSLESKKTAKLA